MTEPAAATYFCPSCGTRSGTGGACDRDHAPLVAITASSLLGTEVGHYVLVERLGEGGMGAVYRAVQPAIGAEVAIKVLHASPGERAQRFLLEAQAVNRVRHANLIRIIDTGYLSDRRPYLVMELLDGMSLADAVGRMAPPLAATVAAEVLDALDAVHGEGIVHRDLKPPNVFLGSDGRVVVLDFGIAKLVDGEVVTHSSGLIGTPEYMAPEQIRAQPVDRRTDVYAIGVMLYETITGRRPFAAAATFDMLVQHLEQPPTSPREYAPNLSLPLADVILRALEKQPASRFASARDMAAALRATGVATRDDLVAFVARHARTRPPPAMSRTADSATARERPPSRQVDRSATRREIPAERLASAGRKRGIVAFVPHLAIGAALAAVAAFFILRGDEHGPAPVAPAGGSGSAASVTTPDAVAAAPAPSEPITTATAQAACMRMNARLRTCTDVFIPALVGWRVELDVPAGITGFDRHNGRAKVVANALKAWWDNNSDAKFTATCAETSRDVDSAGVRASVDYDQRCAPAKDCEAFVHCVEPLQRMSLAAARTAPDPEPPPPTQPNAASLDCTAIAKHAVTLVDKDWRRVHGQPITQKDADESQAKTLKNCAAWSTTMRSCTMNATTLAASQACADVDARHQCVPIAQHVAELLEADVKAHYHKSPTPAAMDQSTSRLLNRCIVEWSAATRACAAKATTIEQATMKCGPGVDARVTIDGSVDDVEGP